MHSHGVIYREAKGRPIRWFLYVKFVMQKFHSEPNLKLLAYIM